MWLAAMRQVVRLKDSFKPCASQELCSYFSVLETSAV